MEFRFIKIAKKILITLIFALFYVCFVMSVLQNVVFLSVINIKMINLT